MNFLRLKSGVWEIFLLTFSSSSQPDFSMTCFLWSPSIPLNQYSLKIEVEVALSYLSAGRELSLRQSSYHGWTNPFPGRGKAVKAMRKYHIAYCTFLSVLITLLLPA